MQLLDSHISLGIAVQKMDSNVYDNLKDEEMDWALNWAQDNWIRSYFNSLSNKTRQGFEDNQQVTDYLQPLIGTYSVRPYVQPFGHCAFALPNDYLYHDSTQLEVYVDKCGEIVWNETNLSETVYYLQFNTTHAFNYLGVTDFTNFDITLSDKTTSVLPNSIKDNLDKYNFPNDASNLARDVHEQLNGVYWESVFDLYNSGYFIVTTGNYYITMDGSTFMTGNQFNHTSGYYLKEQLSGGEAYWQQARVVETKDLLAAQKHAYKQTQWRSPLCCLRDNKFEIYYDGFAPLNARMYYIKKPKRVSYSLGQDLQVPDNAYNIVIQNAANYILHLFQSKLYKTGENESNQIL